ncbi:hypothetical protein ACTD5D_19575 [Nocardia takedensis]|uniref:hypothetical protein n=1 Tax=Nocardia takedensis TaxID=259390 RepID=UPI003F75C2B9
MSSNAPELLTLNHAFNDLGAHRISFIDDSGTGAISAASWLLGELTARGLPWGR